ncbi:MAG TPA: RNA polymerase sigma-70 factor [Flavisolibacter sp.]|nr:RNA polymerase sigma-70 factor [Flavisolibacter sp.]
MESFASHEDKQLFSLIAAGNEQAFAALFHRYTPRLFPFINKLTRNEHLAEELIQETFLRVWIKREELGQIEFPSAWIYAVASNVSLTFLRTQANRKRLLQKVEATSADESLHYLLDTKELGLLIRDAVDRLPQRRRELYLLSREEGLTHQQIADKLGLSANTVKNQIGLSLKFIQEVISQRTGLSLLTVVALLGG